MDYMKFMIGIFVGGASVLTGIFFLVISLAVLTFGYDTVESSVYDEAADKYINTSLTGASLTADANLKTGYKSFTTNGPLVLGLGGSLVGALGILMSVFGVWIVYTTFSSFRQNTKQKADGY